MLRNMRTRIPGYTIVLIFVFFITHPNVLHALYQAEPLSVTKSITLTSDLEFDSTGLVVKGDDIVIDLAGHTITFNNADTVEVPNREFESWVAGAPIDWTVVSGQVSQGVTFMNNRYSRPESVAVTGKAFKFGYWTGTVSLNTFSVAPARTGEIEVTDRSNWEIGGSGSKGFFFGSSNFRFSVIDERRETSSSFSLTLQVTTSDGNRLLERDLQTPVAITFPVPEQFFTGTSAPLDHYAYSIDNSPLTIMTDLSGHGESTYIFQPAKDKNIKIMVGDSGISYSEETVVEPGWYSPYIREILLSD